MREADEPITADEIEVMVDASEVELLLGDGQHTRAGLVAAAHFALL